MQKTQLYGNSQNGVCHILETVLLTSREILHPFCQWYLHGAEPVHPMEYPGSSGCTSSVILDAILVVHSILEDICLAHS